MIRRPSRPLHPADRPEVAPGRTPVALRVVPDVPGTDPAGVHRRTLTSRFDLAPERVLVQIVVPRESREVVAGGLAEHATSEAPACERTVDTPEWLDAHEVAQRQHVQRDLKAELPVDVARRVCTLARLVVLHDAARAERIDVDPVDLSREPEIVGE